MRAATESNSAALPLATCSARGWRQLQILGLDTPLLLPRGGPVEAHPSVSPNQPCETCLRASTLQSAACFGAPFGDSGGASLPGAPSPLGCEPVSTVRGQGAERQ